MLSMLGLMGGKAIGKYIAIGLAAVAVVAFIYIGWTSYNKAIAKSASVEIKLKDANTETEVANANTESVVQILQSERTDSHREINRLQHLSSVRKRRANETSAALARMYNALDNGDAVTQFNRMLVSRLERIQGESFNDTEKRNASDTGTTGTGAPFVPFSCFDKETATKMIHNATAIADFADDVEALRVKREMPNRPLDKQKQAAEKD